VKVIARRRQGFAHEVEIEGGHTVSVDEPRAAGGSDTGPSPTRLLAASLAACTAITMEVYANHKGWEIGAVEVEVEATYVGATPSAFTVSLHLPAELSDEQRGRLARTARRCPVHKALAGETPVRVTERIEPL
jgi:putative redox protein